MRPSLHPRLRPFACVLTESLRLALSLVAFALVLCVPVDAAKAQPLDLPGLTVTLAWNANQETNIAGYRVHYGFREGDYLRHLDVGNATRSELTLPLPGMKYHFAVTAYDTEGLESLYSREVTYDAPASEIPIPTLAKANTVTEDSEVLIDLLAPVPTGQDPDWILTRPPSRGTLAVRDGLVLYVPQQDFFGTDSFEVVVGLRTKTLTRIAWDILLLPENDPPVAFDAWVTTDAATPVPVVLTGFDAEEDDLTFQLLTLPASGILSGTPPDLLYTPTTHSSDGDFLTFQITDGSLTSLVAQVRIDVEPVFEQSLIRDQLITLQEDSVLTFRLDVADVPGLAIQIIEAPLYGTLTGIPPDLVYQPNPDFFGTDTLIVEVMDLLGRIGISVVYFDVEIVNDPPAIAPFHLHPGTGGRADFQLYAFDPDGDPITFEIVRDPAKGTLSGEPPRLTYRAYPHETGPDFFSYRASDGLLTSDPALVTVSLGAPLPSPPAVEVVPAPSGMFTLRWETTPGHRYQVLYRNSLLSTEWTPLTDALVAQSERLVWTGHRLTNSATGFYAIRVLGP